MNRWSKASLERLKSCHPDLQLLFGKILHIRDCSILCGHRGEAEQNKAKAEGKSQLAWPNSKHNQKPSIAIDVSPWPLQWDKTNDFIYFGGLVMGVAEMLYENGDMCYRLQWGGDWSRDYTQSNNSFNDLVHFQLIV